MVLVPCTSSNDFFFSICMKFQEDIFNVFMSSTNIILSKNCFLKVERGITKNIDIQELWLLCSVHSLMMLTAILV